MDWLLCDVIAYPARMLALVQRWIGAGAPRRVVCTLKFQGATDHETAAGFAAIPGGRVVHLFHNKHELTFLWPVPADSMAHTAVPDSGKPQRAAGV